MTSEAIPTRFWGPTLTRRVSSLKGRRANKTLSGASDLLLAHPITREYVGPSSRRAVDRPGLSRGGGVARTRAI